jgi:hypothetical protein
MQATVRSAPPDLESARIDECLRSAPDKTPTASMREFVDDDAPNVGDSCPGGDDDPRAAEDVSAGLWRCMVTRGLRERRRERQEGKRKRGAHELEASRQPSKQTQKKL